jgi:hypothetical protein
VLKEVMHKWGAGVNWAANLQKDGIGRDRERERDRETDWGRGRAGEMEGDHGDV